LVGKPGGQRPLECPRCESEDNIKKNLKEIGCKDMARFTWLRIVTGYYGRGNKPFGAVYCGKFID
jgi:hypothetical protein